LSTHRTLTTLLLSLFALGGALGCATAVPNELATARAAYGRALRGPASTLNPADLHTAKESLDAAELSFEENGDEQQTRDLSYVAERRTQTAEARARTMQSMAQKEEVVAQMHTNTAAQAQASSAELGRANQQLAAQGQQMQSQGDALATETQRRKDAEKRAAQAAADLAKFASVKQEARGMVITLSGGVLFQSGKSDLLPTAQLKLNDVANALTQQDPDSKIVVEGHTDSQGSSASNQTLSERRAQAVRDYLVSRGIAADRVTSQGFGPARGIADNTSAEGRANNRRVEIVVTPTK
jgi:outer membrane protein OmpA-like peptidoglycan-associated protein